MLRNNCEDRNADLAFKAELRASLQKHFLEQLPSVFADRQHLLGLLFRHREWVERLSAHLFTNVSQVLQECISRAALSCANGTLWNGSIDMIIGMPCQEMGNRFPALGKHQFRFARRLLSVLDIVAALTRFAALSRDTV